MCAGYEMRVPSTGGGGHVCADGGDAGADGKRRSISARTECVSVYAFGLT